MRHRLLSGQEETETVCRLGLAALRNGVLSASPPQPSWLPPTHPFPILTALAFPAHSLTFYWVLLDARHRTGLCGASELSKSLCWALTYLSLLLQCHSPVAPSAVGPGPGLVSPAVSPHPFPYPFARLSTHWGLAMEVLLGDKVF